MRLTRRQTLAMLAQLAAVKRGFQTPPEILDYFRDKNLKPGFSWLDVWGEEHAHAFTVAGVTETRVLSEFAEAIDKALTAGTGFEAFKADMQARLTPRGWWGPKVVSDPTGKWKDKTVDFTKPGRLETTFWSNVRSARAAGQWNRIQRTKESRPYLVYVRSIAERKRPEHLAWVGTIKPVDDSWWRTHYPPNGWGCKCSVQQLDQEDRDAYLAQDGYSEDAPDFGEVDYVNRRTGEVTKVPRGIDPGWQTNPGLARAQTLVTQLTETLAEAGGLRAKPTIAKLWQGNWPKAMAKLDESVQLPVAASPRVAEALGVDTEIVTVANELVAADIAAGKVADAGRYAIVQRIIDAGRLISGARNGLSRVRALIDGKSWTLTLRKGDDGSVAVEKLTSR
jgi:SPP1 gp7 family putative phage head morphogenesis protein